VDKTAELTKPAAIHWVDGPEEERDGLYGEIKLNQKLWPGCYYAGSDAADVARVEGR
jgi:phosphoenolpyruvate carboxykinase (GTP)